MKVRISGKNTDAKPDPLRSWGFCKGDLIYGGEELVPDYGFGPGIGVIVNFHGEKHECLVLGAALGETDVVGVPYNEARLLTPGNYRRYFAGEPLEFGSPVEEMAFWVDIYPPDQVANPVSGLQIWQPDEAMIAVEAGVVDLALELEGRTGGAYVVPYVLCYRFEDRQLGCRLAQGFTVELLRSLINPAV